MAPSTKYFMALSAAMGFSRLKATRPYADSAMISMPMYMLSRLLAEAITITPSNTKSESTKYSPWNIPRAVR